MVKKTKNLVRELQHRFSNSGMGASRSEEEYNRRPSTYENTKCKSRFQVNPNLKHFLHSRHRSKVIKRTPMCLRGRGKQPL